MKVAVFSAKPYDTVLLDKASDSFNVQFSFFSDALNQSTVALCEGFDGVCVFVNDEVNSEVIQRLVKHKITHIALRCAGFNNVDINAAKQAGIRVSRVASYAPEAVAEHAVALMLTLNRKVHKAYNRVREGNFELDGLMGFNLKGKCIGVIGTGHIGKAIAKIMRGFGCQVVCCDPVISPALERLGAIYVSLEALLAQSDIISLHCPLSEDTYHLVDETAIARMRDGVMLINTSRGGLIDTQAVISGLKKGKIGYLGLDVYEMESALFFENRSSEIISDDVFERLATFHNVIITGHQGFFTEEAMHEIATAVVSNLVNHNAALGKCDNIVV
ncbi:2-hydroxyacid dehydrogenase [Alteromonas ponticola]|uniref:2-hydroxyacid dehydrogenase n=1 Tax=Alteromonas ponticola TaxID=2720613 RepID=A0ABX1QZN5_9ALTE|nr:2-hydroxyacid dehydrogenase [Alteromonas ponticola]NMH59690.1 2-hydroxyacid dehydrogenase [Alteromonas ponticola]